MLYKNINSIVAETISSKDSTLFLGNYSIPSDDIPPITHLAVGTKITASEVFVESKYYSDTQRAYYFYITNTNKPPTKNIVMELVYRDLSGDTVHTEVIQAGSFKSNDIIIPTAGAIVDIRLANDSPVTDDNYVYYYGTKPILPESNNISAFE